MSENLSTSTTYKEQEHKHSPTYLYIVQRYIPKLQWWYRVTHICSMKLIGPSDCHTGDSAYLSLYHTVFSNRIFLYPYGWKDQKCSLQIISNQKYKFNNKKCSFKNKSKSGHKNWPLGSFVGFYLLLFRHKFGKPQYIQLWIHTKKNCFRYILLIKQLIKNLPFQWWLAWDTQKDTLTGSNK